MTTLKVESMDFPPVIVCPPQGLSLSNSLKFDLSRLANATLTSAAKKRLKLKARELFKNQAPELYSEKILGLVNEGNIDEVFQGFQSIPDVAGNIAKVKMSSKDGSISSFGSGRPFSGRWCTCTWQCYIFFNYVPRLYKMFSGFEELHYQLQLDGIKDMVR